MFQVQLRLFKKYYLCISFGTATFCHSVKAFLCHRNTLILRRLLIFIYIKQFKKLFQNVFLAENYAAVSYVKEKQY